MKGLTKTGLVLGAGTLAALMPAPAKAVGTLSNGTHETLEQRVAIAIGPGRSTTWTQVRVDAQPGPLAIVMPASPGAALDWSSDAWMESLELATAPRVRPPVALVPACPGEPPPTDPVDVIGQTVHEAALTPLEVTVLADADAVQAWAQSHGMGVTPAVFAGLASLPGSRFVAARFAAPDGEALTPTLRVVAPGVEPVVPLVLTRATSSDLLITLFALTEGRPALDGAPALLDPGELVYDAATSATNYGELRLSTLANSDAWLLEASSRTALTDDVTVPDGGHTIPSAYATYFERSALYDGGFDPVMCILEAQGALDATATVASACPRADLGIVEGVDSCTETVGPTEVAPDELRCGPVSDDLAVALAGQTASGAWLSRFSLSLDASQIGAVRQVLLPGGNPVSPVVDAAVLDQSGCGEGGAGGTGGATSSGAGASSSSGAGGAPPGPGGPVAVPVYEVDHGGCGSSDVGLAPIFYIDFDDEDDAPDGYYVEDEGDCGGDTSESYTPVYEDEGETDGVIDDIEEDSAGDDCGGDSSESYETSEGDGDCGGDSSESYESYEDDGDCGGDSSESYDDGGDCGGDTTDSSDSGSDCGGDSSESGDCSVGRRHKRRPRTSALMIALFGLLAPLRRLTGRRRRRRDRL